MGKIKEILGKDCLISKTAIRHLIGSDHMKYKIGLLSVACLVLLGGCFNMGTSKKANKYEEENFVLIEDYDGEGFTLRDANPKTGEIAEENRDEVIAAVEAYFVSEYDTEVTVHNIVSAVDAVSVYVESVGDPHFYSFAVVPVDLENETVKTDEIWTEEGQVEDGIKGGLYKMAFSEEFEQLDAFLESSTETYPIIGSPQAVIENVKGNGYTTPYYFVSTFGNVFKDIYNAYMEDPSISSEEIHSIISDQPMDKSGVSIGIEFYMSGDEAEPDKEVFDELAKELEEMKELPPGEYFLFLNDGFVDKRRGIGKKENSLERRFIVEQE